MHTAEFEEYLKTNGVKYVIDNYVPIILVPASEFKDAWKMWSSKVKELKYNSSWGVRSENE